MYRKSAQVHKHICDKLPNVAVISTKCSIIIHCDQLLNIAISY